MQASLDRTQTERYSRQLLLEEISETDQQRLLSSRVLVIGAGGLGSPVIQYLTAAGVGKLGIVDGGVVKRSNLQRQVIYRQGDIGESKVRSAERFVEARNDDITVNTYPVQVQVENVNDILSSYDIVVDGLDNFRTRFLVNDAARLANIPFFHGAIYGFEGNLAVFHPDGPCYRCHIPYKPESARIPSGEPMGIFPTTPGTVGCMQATEVLKWILDIGSVIDTEILRIDLFDMTITATPLEQKSDCPICGESSISALSEIDYTGDCRIK